MNRHRLGSWSCPSGNSVDVFLSPSGDAIRDLELEWDCLPLSAADDLYYKVAILPQITRRVAEYLEFPPARALLVAL